LKGGKASCKKLAKERKEKTTPSSLRDDYCHNFGGLDHREVLRNLVLDLFQGAQNGSNQGAAGFGLE